MSLVNKIGIMQGRLSPPKKNLIQHFPKDWQTEFDHCKSLGLKSIEWVFEEPDIKFNPIFNPELFENFLNIKKKFDIEVNSVVADYFMKNKLFQENNSNTEKNINTLKTLIINCYKLNIKIIELPLVDSSALQNEENMREFKSNLNDLLSFAESLNVKISLETDLEPEKFLNYIKTFNSKNLYVNFDMGNSASNGFDPEKEIEILSEYIINVHIKDRIYKGNTVELGKGDVDFKKVFKMLKKIGYANDLILQAYREDINNEKKNYLKTVQKYKNFTINQINNA
tara:strand:+ start:2366 stop:3214 length:849 start_codon:yes stop_codon:yes gene_type:complete